MAQKTWTGAASGDYSAAGNWESTAVPVDGDDVRLPAGAPAITAGLDQSTVHIGDFIVEDGFTSAIGSTSAYLQIDPDRFEFSGSGVSLINLGTAAIPAEIKKTARVGTGQRGLYLLGTGITKLSARSGQIGVASLHGSTSTLNTLEVVGSQADVWIGEGCALTKCNIKEGTAELRSGTSDTDIDVYGGSLTTEEVAAFGTINVWEGNAVLNALGTIAALNCEGGRTDLLQSGSTRSIGTLKVNPGAELAYDPAVVGVTTRSAPDRPIRISATAP